MIADVDITTIGRIIKPHGISGELSAVFEDFDLEDIRKLRCIILKIDGINVPFFISELRPRKVDTLLLTIDGITDECQASELSNHEIFALKADVPECDIENDEDGFYAVDLIGFDVVLTDGTILGTITDVDDSTENVLFVVSQTNLKSIYIPVTDEFITEIYAESNRIVMELPDGLIDLN